MKNWCATCNEETEWEDGQHCPVCGHAREPETVETVLQTDAVELQATIADTSSGQRSEPPAASIMNSEDETLLRRGVIAPPNTPGSRGSIGRFEIIRLLGKGGMGYVYLAKEPMTETEVAVKVLKPEMLDNDRAVKSFLSEARHMYGLSHPNILKVMEVSDGEHGPFLVMPYAQGGNLRQQLESRTPLDQHKVLTIASEIAEALTHAHRKGIIHRDLKPDNVLLTEDGRTQLTDFGLVRSLFNDPLLDVTSNTTEGTPAYMSPAVAEGKVEDTRCDIYSFGAMLYEMLTGKPPYSGSSVQEILTAVKNTAPATISSVNPNAPAGLASVAEGCMARELRTRYASMDDVVSDLKRIAENKKPLGPTGSARSQRDRNPLLLGIATVAGFALLLFAGREFLLQDPAPPAAPAGTSPSRAKPLPPVNEIGEDASIDELTALAAGYKEQARWHMFIQTQHQLITLDPGNETAHAEIADHLMKVNHLAAAYDSVTVWLSHVPDSARALELKAQLEDLGAHELQHTRQPPGGGGNNTSGPGNYAPDGNQRPGPGNRGPEFRQGDRTRPGPRRPGPPSDGQRPGPPGHSNAPEHPLHETGRPQAPPR